MRRSLFLALVLFARTAAADEPRPPLPEPLLTESATDVDADEDGELELEANGTSLGARRGGGRVTLASVEAEWRAFRRVGFRLEPSWARVVDRGGVDAHTVLGVNGAIALSLAHDYARDLHLQAELVGRVPRDAGDGALDPGEAELPIALDLVGAMRRGPLTIRATVGAEGGATPAHAPLHTDVAVLAPFAGSTRFGFLALEARVDWARETPLVLAPELVVDLRPLDLPFRLGTAVPWNVGADATAASHGVFMRLVFVAEREEEYGTR